METDSDTDDRIDIADHVVATSESEPPEETVARLFGGHDPLASVRAQETVAKLFGKYDGQETARVQEAMAEFFDEGGQQAGESQGEHGGSCGAGAVLHPDEETRHELRFDDRVEYGHCVDGVLIAAELVDHEPVTVRSFDPVSDEPVTFELAADRRVVTPEGALVSMGMAEAVPDSEDMISFGVAMANGENDPGAYVEDPLDVFCRNFNAFEDRETYERWSAEVDAVSVAVPAAVFASMIRRLVSGPAFD